MATAQVKVAYARIKRPILVVDRFGRPCWNEVFDNNPKILKAPRPNAVRVMNGSGCRPYIVSKTKTHWTWKRWGITPGELFLSVAEKEFAAPHAGAILIEPTTKVLDGNKAWIWERWQELVDGGGKYVQVGPEGTRRLVGVKHVMTPTFRHACAVLSVSRAFVGAEGGLHHAAAALGVPAVVLFSGFISPEVTGYSGHINLRKSQAGLGCGSRIPCECCRKSMAAITVSEVAEGLAPFLGSSG